ncbi:hypothetical protein ACFYO9_10545 [Streptomyces sp. NPDC005863]|uniref:hypothetical protein n=1 Tax=unclassified Streptomyces TaxID=2593676 RepID=UPI0033F401B5
MTPTGGVVLGHPCGGDGLGITRAAVSTGPWHEHTNTELRDAQRELAGAGWHLLADADGRLAHWWAEAGLDRAFPPGGHLSHCLLKGNPRNFVLVRSDITVAFGNHRAPGHKPGPAARTASAP